MKHIARRLCAVAFCFGLWSAGALGQSRGVDDAMLLKPLADNWPTYSGDYSGRRYSLLTQANQTTVKNLTLAWTARLTGGSVTPAPSRLTAQVLPENVMFLPTPGGGRNTGG